MTQSQRPTDTHISRREMLAASATVVAASAVTIVPRHVLGGAGNVPPSEKVNLAFIGVGGRAESNIGERIKESVNVVALCDVDDARAGGTYKQFPDVPKYRDFRVMLDERDKEIDAVVVSTPDHMHAPATLAAIARGKHVY